MSSLARDAIKPELSDNCFIEVEVEPTSHLIFMTADLPTEDTYILPTPVSLQVITVNDPLEVPKRESENFILPQTYSCENCQFNTTSVELYHKHQESHWVVKKKVDKQKDGRVTKNASEKEVSEESTEYKCPHCNYYPSSIRSLRIHMNIHKSGNSFQCLDCNFRGKNLEELIRHHKRSKTMSCKYCTFSTHNKEMFKSHKKNNHAAKWFGCMRCNFAAADRGYLAKHIMEHHSKVMRFEPLPPELEPNYQEQI